MELVYLWVENYKNIHRQGFNFSAKFNCHYDADNNELTIDENDDYIENFFGDNINVTAIVGKNGSGKSSILEILNNLYKIKTGKIIVYKKDNKYYCEFCDNAPAVIFRENIEYISCEDMHNNFHPRTFQVASAKKTGKPRLPIYYFGDYSGLYGGLNIERQNFYNMLEARFFAPRYVNIALEYFEIFKALKQMYKFDTVRLILRDNSTEYVRKYIDNEISMFRNYSRVQSNLNGKFCVYEKNEQTLSRIQQDIRVPIEEVEINLYNKEREKIVSTLEEIERIHRSQTYDDQITKYNKYTEFDIAILIAFIEYYLKSREPCETCQLIYAELLKLEKEIKNNLSIYEHRMRVVQSYILGFFENLKKQNFAFEKDDLISIDEIIQSIEYFQKFEVTYFNVDGSPYVDIPIDEDLKDNLPHLKIMQKIFFDHEFDCGNEEYLRVFEYNLINNQVGSSYETISDGEKHFIRFTIDIIYYLQTLKQWNVNPDKEQLAIFLADEPDNALHPIWKKRVISSVMEIFKHYMDMPNITVHFMYTTHSPFLLSDIPKQNIIFLDTYKNEDKNVKDNKQKIGNCKVLKHDEVMDKKQTFGQNIHTLLSNSFFMNDGLMGEFAKEKINKIIKFLREDKISEPREEWLESKEGLKRIIDIIGEPFLQHKVLELYYDKFTDDGTRKERKKELEEQKKQIERELSKYD